MWSNVTKVYKLRKFFDKYRLCCISAGLIGIQIFVTTPLYILLREFQRQRFLKKILSITRISGSGDHKAAQKEAEPEINKSALSTTPKLPVSERMLAEAAKKEPSMLGKILNAPQNFWIKYDIANRLQFNSFMNATSMMTWTLLAGMKFPTTSAYGGFVYVIGRLVYVIADSQKEFIPQLAPFGVLGSLLCTVATVTNGILSIFGGMQVYIKMMKQSYEAMLEGLKTKKPIEETTVDIPLGILD